MNIVQELIKIYSLDLNTLSDDFRAKIEAAASKDTENLAHSIHHESIRIDQDQRCKVDIDWMEEYFKVLNLGCDLADKILGC
jgi:hypothetical protein